MSVDVYVSTERVVGGRSIITPLKGNFNDALNLTVFNAATLLKLLGYEVDVNDLSMTITDVDDLIVRIKCALGTIRSMPGLVTRPDEVYQDNEGPVLIHFNMDDEGAYRRLSAMLRIAEEAKAQKASVSIV